MSEPGQKAGYGWIVTQAGLVLIVFLGRPLYFFVLPVYIKISSLLVLGLGGFLFFAGMINLGRNLTPLPRPVKGGVLVTHGVYRIVRHPVYSGLILGVAGWGVLFSDSFRIGTAVVLFFFFDAKSRYEEKMLVQVFPEYPAYRGRVKRLVPWLY